MMYLKRKSMTFNLHKEDCNVLILNPFIILVRLHLLMFSSMTSFSPVFLLRLPMLMLWPGPHNILKMVKLVQLKLIEMQSSLVLMIELATWILIELAIWMPSMLGLSPGALILIESKVMFLNSKIWMWKNLLSIKEMLLMVAFMMEPNTKF